MDPAELIAWLAVQAITQRDKLTLLRAEYFDVIRAFHDDDFVHVLREARKRLSSPKLLAARDALIDDLGRDRPANPRPLVVPPSPSDPAWVDTVVSHDLEAAIAADPQSREAYMVYGDWLQERGDPRGVLIAIGAELAKSPDHRAMLASHGKHLADHPELLGPLRTCLDVVTQLDWYCGFIRGCRVAYTQQRFNAPGPRFRKPHDLVDVAIPDVIAWLLDDPGPGRYLQTLVVGLVRHDANHYGGVAEVLARHARPTLRALSLGDFARSECELNWSELGDLSKLWPALPNLRSLVLRGGTMGLAGIRLPALEELTTITGGLDAVSARAIADAEWPALTRLSLQYGPEGTANFDAIAPLLDGSRLPRLRHLGITNCEHTDEVCDALPRSGILPRLTELDLSMGTMSEAGLAVLFREPAKFAHLATIDLDDNYLPVAAREQLALVLPNVHFGDQRLVDDDNVRHASAFE